jgi:uncharacterized membrane protein YcaP (DUF421 family)
MFFNGWDNVARVIIVGVLAYTALIAVLRISGKRTLSKMNAFDLIVTVALGSTLATILLSKDVSLAEGITSFLTLIGLQYLIAWLSVRSETVRNIVKSQPRLLFFRGDFLEPAMRNERITHDEIVAAIRSQGIPQIEQAEAVVLEADGSLIALKRSETGKATTLHSVRGSAHEH